MSIFSGPKRCSPLLFANTFGRVQDQSPNEDSPFFADFTCECCQWHTWGSVYTNCSNLTNPDPRMRMPLLAGPCFRCVVRLVHPDVDVSKRRTPFLFRSVPSKLSNSFALGGATPLPFLLWHLARPASHLKFEFEKQGAPLR